MIIYILHYSKCILNSTHSLFIRRYSITTERIILQPYTEVKTEFFLTFIPNLEEDRLLLSRREQYSMCLLLVADKAITDFKIQMIKYQILSILTEVRVHICLQREGRNQIMHIIQKRQWNSDWSNLCDLSIFFFKVHFKFVLCLYVSTDLTSFAP